MPAYRSAPQLSPARSPPLSFSFPGTVCLLIGLCTISSHPGGSRHLVRLEKNGPTPIQLLSLNLLHASVVRVGIVVVKTASSRHKQTATAATVRLFRQLIRYVVKKSRRTPHPKPYAIRAMQITMTGNARVKRTTVAL